MSLIKWEPLREFEDLFDRYSKSVGWPVARAQDLITTGEWSPRVDITEKKNEFLIKAEIPEVKKEDVKVSMDNGVLTIQGEKKQEEEEEGEQYHRIERFYGSFMRSFSLPENIDVNHIQATYKEGVLNLHIPKTAESRPKAIEVQVQ